MCCNSKSVDVIETPRAENTEKKSKKNSESEISMENDTENKINKNDDDNDYSKFDKKK